MFILSHGLSSFNSEPKIEQLKKEQPKQKKKSFFFSLFNKSQQLDQPAPVDRLTSIDQSSTLTRHRNVKAYDKEGNELWLIEDIGGTNPIRGYADIWIENDKLLVDDGTYEFLIDIETGVILGAADARFGAADNWYDRPESWAFKRPSQEE